MQTTIYTNFSFMVINIGFKMFLGASLATVPCCRSVNRQPSFESTSTSTLTFFENNKLIGRSSLVPCYQRLKKFLLFLPFMVGREGTSEKLPRKSSRLQSSTGQRRLPTQMGCCDGNTLLEILFILPTKPAP